MLLREIANSLLFIPNLFGDVLCDATCFVQLESMSHLLLINEPCFEDIELYFF